MAVSGTSSGARVNVTARMTTPPCAPRSLEVSFSKTGNPITNIALAPAAMIEWAAPLRNVAVAPGVIKRAAARVGGEVINMISQATEPATVAQMNPTSCHPITNVAAATTTRMTASATISAPYWVHRLVPASMPSRVACRQNPASPMLSNATDSQRASANTRPLHNGELPAITTNEPRPTIPETRSGWVRRPSAETSKYPSERTSRVVSCSRPLAAPVTSPNAPQNTPNTEKPLGARLRAAR